MDKLQKIEVATGVYWVEVPEANVFILCGCPADSVKHLMRKNLIRWTEIDGVRCETGPNAILLSDIMLQNGNFANLAEFPVLQMLYRQGMLLPNHPNNTGKKPLLIGSNEQVKAQMEYIYRGNYGLTSEEEIIATGTSAEVAKEMMRMKLKFAFGKIRNSDELLDKIILPKDPTEIDNGVYVQRKSLNVFEISYEGESVEINLNLSPMEVYGASYPLGFHNIKRESFSIVHAGDGDGWDINRPTMGSIIMYQGKIYLIDAGPNIHLTLEALGISVNEIEGIFHTHGHDDHFCGLPTFMRSDHRIQYYATPLVRSAVFKKLSALLSLEEEQLEGFFDIQDLEMGIWNNVKGMEVKPIFSPHPVETTIFMFRAIGQEGKRTYAHFADIVSLDILKNMITDDFKTPGISQELYDQVKSDYLEPVSLKKLDIGGGMIHGNALDFKEDKSEKIFLSHTSIPLTAEQRVVGSGAPFGIVNTLIPTHQEYARKHASQYLRDYFPSIPSYMISTLLNNKVVTFDPMSIILKEGCAIDAIYLVLSGNVEILKASNLSEPRNLSAGTLLGEIAGLHKLPTMATYRARNYVDALRIPIEMYRNFVDEFGLFKSISKLMEGRELLNASWLCRDGLSYSVQNHVAKALTVKTYETGEIILVNDADHLHLIQEGSGVLAIGNKIMEVLTKGDFCGEDVTLFDSPIGYSLKALTTLHICQIPSSLLKEIPIIHWKLLETYQRRLRLSSQ